MSTTLEEDANYVANSKWQMLQSYSKNAIRKGDRWDTTLEYNFENGEQLTVRADLKNGQVLPARDGFEYLQVKIPSEPASTTTEDVRRLLLREKIVGWLFERWTASGEPITLSGLAAGPAIEAGIYTAIKFPDGKIQAVGLERIITTSMRDVPSSLLLANEEEWLEIVSAHYIA